MINTNAGGGEGEGALSVEFQASLRPRFTRGLLTFNFFKLLYAITIYFVRKL